MGGMLSSMNLFALYFSAFLDNQRTEFSFPLRIAVQLVVMFSISFGTLNYTLASMVEI